MLAPCFILCLFLVIFTSLTNSVENAPEPVRIAVCVSGQQSRWYPEYLVDNLIRNNPDQRFYLFFNLLADVIGDKESHQTSFSLSPMAHLNESDTKEKLQGLLRDIANAKVASYQMHTSESQSYWSEVLKGLDRFQHHAPSGLFNIYQAEVNCSKSIIAYEEQQRRITEAQRDKPDFDQNWKFDYVISTREDAYFFQPLHLLKALPALRTDRSAKEGSQCDVIFKNCVSFGGYNMRMYIMNRETGLLMLGKKLEFYTIMRVNGWYAPNAHIYEKMLADQYDITGCPQSIDVMPVTAARHSSNGDVCLYSFELDACVPRDSAEKVVQFLRCEDVEKNHNSLPVISTSSATTLTATSTQSTSSAVTRPENSPKRIAVCVNGQQSRWQPEFLFQNVILNNPSLEMHIFFNIQVGTGSNLEVHSTGRGFKPTEMTHLNVSATLNKLNSLLGGAQHAKIASYQTYTVESHSYWTQIVHGPLDRFKQFNMKDGHPITTNIMNMYHAQVKCAHQIQEYEKNQSKAQGTENPNWRFDYIINTREDAYFFEPMDIPSQLPLLRLDMTMKSGPQCDLLFKNCLLFGGYNMRLYIMNRDAGLLMIGKRFEFFEIMRVNGWHAINPENYELMQAGQYDLNGCPQVVDHIPVTAARHIGNGNICLYKFELDTCFPKGDADKVNSILRCEDYEKYPEKYASTTTTASAPTTTASAPTTTAAAPTTTAAAPTTTSTTAPAATTASEDAAAAFAAARLVPVAVTANTVTTVSTGTPATATTASADAAAAFAATSAAQSLS